MGDSAVGYERALIDRALDRRDEQDAGRIDAILTVPRAHGETGEEARSCIDYLTHHRHRMRYPELRASGFAVSSGFVEAGCRHAIGDRFERAGMRWIVAGANAVVALPSCRLSGRFEGFRERTGRKAV